MALTQATSYRTRRTSCPSFCQRTKLKSIRSAKKSTHSRYRCCPGASSSCLNNAISPAMVMTWTVLLVQAQGASGAGDLPCSYLHEHCSHSMSLLSDGPPYASMLSCRASRAARHPCCEWHAGDSRDPWNSRSSRHARSQRHPGTSRHTRNARHPGSSRCTTLPLGLGSPQALETVGPRFWAMFAQIGLPALPGPPVLVSMQWWPLQLCLGA